MTASAIFFQTSDADVYREMLAQSSRTVRLYCRRHGYGYETYTGLKFGARPWHASYNRIFIFGELVARGWRGWAIYLDADAYIVDQRFALDEMLSLHADKAAIMAPCGEAQDWWDVNTGVMMLNLGHRRARDLVGRWRRRLDRAPHAALLDAPDWAPPALDDQSLLQIALRERPRFRRDLYLADPHVLNWPKASFIRQLLRLAGDVELRTEVIRREVEAALQVDD